MSSIPLVLNNSARNHLFDEVAPKDSIAQKPREELAPQPSSQLLDQKLSFERQAMKVLDHLQSMQTQREFQIHQIENTLKELLDTTNCRTEQLRKMREQLGQMGETIALQKASVTEKLQELGSSKPLTLMEKTKLAILLLAPPLLCALGRSFLAGVASKPETHLLEMTAGAIQLIQFCWHGCTKGTAGLRKFSESAPQQLTWIVAASLWYTRAAGLAEGWSP